MPNTWRVRATKGWRIAVATAVALVAPELALAQTAPAGPMTLNDAVQLALKNYPAIAETRARAAAADAGVEVAKTANLPRLDAIWQENRATANNVFGLMLPQAVIPPISGPVLASHAYDGVWSSAAGLLMSWDAVDFGLRKAGVEAARAQSDLAQARRSLTELEVAAAAADAYLSVLAADEAVRSSQANVDRLQIFANSVRTLVTNQLRPGADQSRADAELAIARNQLSQAVQVAEIARATLGEAIGAAGTTPQLSPDGLTTSPDLTAPAASDVKMHPAARLDFAAIEAERARERALDRSVEPRITLQSSLFGRGSGADAPGVPSLGNGLLPQVPNWAIGASITFPLMESFNVKPRQRVEAANEAAESARYQQTLQRLTTQEVRARALMKAATEIARNTPIERQAATDAESRARVRYESGLATILEVAESQRLLAQAEVDDALARLGLWRALLAQAQVRGDLTSFLNQIK
jgi:outer membrane protein